jgi:hypothetical protein
MNSDDAKQFLVSRIVDQALLEGVEFSELERKMLFYSETHPSLPDMDTVLIEFNQTYNMFPYEGLVSSLIGNVYRRDRKDPALVQQWKDARSTLRREDHYINVMLKRGLAMATRKRDLLIYIAIGIAVVFALLGFIAWSR